MSVTAGNSPSLRALIADDGPLGLQRLRHDLVRKIELAAQNSLAQLPTSSQCFAGTDTYEELQATAEIVALGTSTGGPKALQEILPQLPADLPVAMIVVQHMPRGFTTSLAERLDHLSKVKVREARQGDVLEPGIVYIAPAGRHATLWRKPGSKTAICLSDSPSGTLHNPSIDVTMLSVAEVFGRHAVGIILTGMGADGVRGMTAIRNAGGITIGQDEATSGVYGMLLRREWDPAKDRAALSSTVANPACCPLPAMRIAQVLR